ncbi:MAG TPA: alternative ribosome rescue aminoacyl-tRNA hydrolase ArfB [Caulobacteraceae bacterium]|nr:alternative ribosome rescue aminoacyl-tRNA hydrolase ArfB [Caulobacteraceae bacterium]
MAAIRITDSLSLDEKELRFVFIASPGPGGQNVNKLATAAQLRFDVAASPSLTQEVKARLLQLAGARATGEGEIVISARRFRSQERNRADALDRLVRLVAAAAAPPPPPRRRTRPPRAAVRARREAKSRRSALKALRAAPSGGEEI